MQKRLDGQVAVMVGGTSGLGRAVGLELASLGAQVVVASRDLGRVEDTVAEVQRAGGKAMGRVIDASDEAQVDGLFEEVKCCFGRLDVMMCTAGQGLIKPIAETSLDDLMGVIRGNIFPVYFTSRAAVRIMQPQGSGLIVQVSSRAALGGGPGKSPLAVYSAAKGGVAAFTQKLGAEVKKFGINVLLLSPAPMSTPTRLRSTPDFDLSRAIKPEQLAGLITYFALNPEVVMESNLVPVALSY
jgi:NAD(P)-dependent dehydrogenase (short-subunit alcohol dehydrogenase family)